MATPTMTRQDFQFIADVIARIHPHTLHEFCGSTAEARRHEIARIFATALASTNPSFNRARFLAACGVSDG